MRFLVRAKVSLRMKKFRRLEVAFHNQNGDIVREAKSLVEFDRRVKNFIHNPLGRQRGTTSYYRRETLNAEFFSYLILCFREAIGVEDRNVTDTKFQLVDLASRSGKHAQWRTRRVHRQCFTRLFLKQK